MNAKTIIHEIQQSLEKSDFDALLLTGVGNIRYAGGVVLPFAAARRRQAMALLWPRSAGPVLFIPDEWADSIGPSSWVKETRSYPAGKGTGALADLISHEIGELSGAGLVGIDTESTSRALYSLLEQTARSVQWRPCDDLVRQLRSRKSAAEQELLKSLALKADHAVNGCLHHITVDRRTSELTLAEEIRVHSLERYVDLQGYNAASQVAGGEETRQFWPNAPKFGYARTRDLREGDTIRVQHQHTRDGYWGVSARMMVNKSHLNEEQIEAYTFLNEAHALLMAELKPGISCSDVFKKVSSAAELKEIPLAAQYGFGHGVGVSPYEAPFISESDDTIIREDMVLVLDPVISAADGIYRSANTIIVGKNGTEVVGWYKDWREPYTPIMSI